MRNAVLDNDLPWALFYRDKLPLPEIAMRLGCSPADLSPELAAPLADVLKSYQASLKGEQRNQ